MARRKRFVQIGGSIFDDLLVRVDELNGDLKGIVSKVYEDAAHTIEEDTIKAMDKSNLPAKGKYSHGRAEKAILHDQKMEWSGFIGTINIGFDKSKASYSSLLITGTPRMKPNSALAKIYSSRAYEKKLQEKINKQIEDYIDDIMGG